MRFIKFTEYFWGRTLQGKIIEHTPCAKYTTVAGRYAVVNTTKFMMPAAAEIPNLLKVSTKGLPIVPKLFHG